MTPDLEVIRQKPQKFGSIGNAHHVDLGGPWTHSYEPVFNFADSYFPHVVDHLIQLNSEFDVIGRPFVERFYLENISERLEREISECLASLVVRSPRFRKVISNSVDHFGAYSDPIDDRHLIIASNIGSCFGSVMESILHCGLKFILFSEGAEFVFGDGFLNNFNAYANLNSRVKLIVPLTPYICLCCSSPSGLYKKGIRTIRLNSDEVRVINFSTQIYSSKYIFFRRQMPVVERNYFDGEFKQLRFHELPLLKAMTQAFSVS